MLLSSSLLCGVSSLLLLIIVVEFAGCSPSSASVVETVDAVPLVAPPQRPRTQYCEYYNASSCLGNSTGCYDKEECESQDPDKRNHCYVLWSKDNVTGENIITLKGCFLDNGECYKTECVEESFRPKGVFFCCCDGNMCNQNFTLSPVPTESTVKKVNHQPVEDDHLLTPIICLVIAIAIVIVGAALGLWWYARKKSNRFNELPTAEPSLSCPPSPEGNEDLKHLTIVLREVRARGRFGAVWRAHLNNQEVAVKVFPVQDKQSWVTEQEIFKLPRMNHPDILQFIGIDKKGDNLQAEYWLVTAYHEKGSLCDYLKGNTLTWADAWKIAHTMARGLTHLHDEVAAATLGRNTKWDRKPAIAHRDFKSKNVLLKNDMSACIADFGLALVFHPGKPCGNTHGQVGTRRYMAPEVLEGAINFTRDAFLRIDMYACGLVLWEIVSRCTAWGNVSEYMLPLEEEVGAHPTLEEMQDAVVLRKLRPGIPQSWREHNAISVICDTMEECWDHDAEARLSASCVMERIGALSQLSRRQQQHQPLLIENACVLRDD